MTATAEVEPHLDILALKNNNFQIHLFCETQLSPKLSSWT